jgi:hypothetical protein
MTTELHTLAAPDKTRSWRQRADREERRIVADEIPDPQEHREAGIVERSGHACIQQRVERWRDVHGIGRGGPEDRLDSPAIVLDQQLLAVPVPACEHLVGAHAIRERSFDLVTIRARARAENDRHRRRASERRTLGCPRGQRKVFLVTRA